jgi:isopenicillin N synthase-like dioxygenase
MIPVIDLGGALAPGGPRCDAVAAQLRQAAMGSGFFYVTGHGIGAALVERQFATACWRWTTVVPAAACPHP